MLFLAHIMQQVVCWLRPKPQRRGSMLPRPVTDPGEGKRKGRGGERKEEGNERKEIAGTGGSHPNFLNVP